MSNCQNCTNQCFINGIGNKNAKLIFLFDHPVLDDELSGKYMDGNTGNFIKKFLQENNIPLSECYFLPMIGFLPRNDECKIIKVKKEHITKCKEKLIEKLTSFKNKQYIILCGANVLKEFTGLTSITKARGIISYDEQLKCNIFPIINPMALLRDLKNKGILIQDINEINRLIQGGEQKGKIKNNYIYIDTIEKFNAYVKRLHEVDLFAIDTETTGLNIMKDKVISLSFSWKEHTGICIPIYEQLIYNKATYKKTDLPELKPFWKENQNYVIEELKKVFINSAKKINHNIKFDAEMIYKSFGVKLNNIYADTLYMHHLLDENAIGMHDLKMLTSLYTDMGNYEAKRDEFFENNPAVKNLFIYLPKDILIEYSAADTDCALRLFNIFDKKLKEEKLDYLFYNFTMPFVEVLIDAELRGFKIDVDYLNVVKKELEDEINPLKEELDKFTGGINLNSPKQLQIFLFKKTY